MIKRFIVSVAVVTLAVVGYASPAQAGGLGDFYWAYVCWPLKSQYPNARLDVTNYDKGTGQEYHIDADGGGLQVLSVYIDGVRQPYTTTDFFKYFAVKNGIHKISAKWASAYNTHTCYIYQ